MIQILYPRSHIYHFPVPNFTIEIPIPILINSASSKAWLERLDAGERRAQASKTNLNLRGIVMRAFAPVCGVFSKKERTLETTLNWIPFDRRILQTFWVFQNLRRFTTFLLSQGTSHLYSNNA